MTIILAEVLGEVYKIFYTFWTLTKNLGAYWDGYCSMPVQ